MSRVVNVRMTEDTVVERCNAADVGISALETLPGGGVRLVCKSSDGAETIRRKLKSHLIKDDDVERSLYRPTRPLW